MIPPLHNKLGLMKQFVEALNKEGACFFKMFSREVPNLSAEKVTEGVFVGHKIRKLTNNSNFYLP